MGRPRKYSNSAGIGKCGSPGCTNDKAPGHFLCSDHVESIQRIKDELSNQQVKGNYANGFRDPGQGNLKTRQAPTCCALGCFEIRIPPRAFCSEHEDLEDCDQC